MPTVILEAWVKPGERHPQHPVDRQPSVHRTSPEPRPHEERDQGDREDELSRGGGVDGGGARELHPARLRIERQRAQESEPARLVRDDGLEDDVATLAEQPHGPDHALRLVESVGDRLTPHVEPPVQEDAASVRGDTMELPPFVRQARPSHAMAM